MTGGYLEDELRGYLVRFIYSIIFWVCKYLICLVRARWVRTGLVSSYLDMSGIWRMYEEGLWLDLFREGFKN